MFPTLREIKLFVAVYEEQSFTAAAVREHATQSGVSQHIRNLEDRLGVQLLARLKGVQPTPAGTAYYGRCIEVLKAHALARRTLDEFAVGLSGSLVVGLIPTLNRCILAPAFMRFRAMHPNVNVRVIEAYVPQMTNSLRAGELDFAILPNVPTLTTGVKISHFAQSPEFLVSSVYNALPEKSPVRLACVESLKLVLPGPDNFRRTEMEKYFTDNGITVESRLEFDTVYGILDLVASSEWRAILPGFMIAGDLGSDRLTFNPLEGPSLFQQLFVVEPERQPLSAAAKAFLETLREASEEVGATLAHQFA